MKKFLSLILALTLVASLFTVNVMAASKAHTVTITADPAKDLKAGDTVTIELAMDNTEALVQCGYVLTFDETVFAADTTKVSRLEKCIDKPWMDGIKDTDGDWGYYLGTPTYKVSADNFNFQWAGAEGVEADYAIDNRVIGKFYLTVKDGAADGEYTFALTGTTTDAGETLGTDIVCAPITVKVGADAPAVVNPTIGAATANGTDGVAITGTDKKYDNAIAVTSTITPGSATEIGMLFVPALVNDWAKAAKATYGAALGNGNVTLVAALKNIPRALQGTAFDMLSKVYAVVDGAEVYGDVLTTTINFGSTGEVE